MTLPSRTAITSHSRLPQQHPPSRQCGGRRSLSLAPARIRQVARLRDRTTSARQAARGYLAPGWSLDLALGQIAKLRSQPAATSTWSLARRAAPRPRPSPATGGPRDQDRRARSLSGHRPPDGAADGLRPTTPARRRRHPLPNGEAIYAAALAEATTTNMTPDEVHQLGLSQVAEYTASLDGILKQAGMTQGSVGERLAALNTAPAQLYAEHRRRPRRADREPQRQCEG